MIEHPDFLNVRKLVILMVSGPFILLAVLAAIDLSWHQFGDRQEAEVCCTQAHLDSTSKLYFKRL
jgi:hypothetical protein